VEFFTDAEAAQLVWSEYDYHTRDLFEAIARGDHPSWTLHAQIMPFDDAPGYRFNPFDLTKVWPHSDYPLVELGRMTLDRNPVDNHTEIEQAAFQPNNLVPGIGPSPDRMLLARLFAYADSHRYRLGVNYQQLPVNAPAVPVHTYSKDGAMRFVNRTDPVYWPNSKGGPRADSARYAPPSWYAAGEIMRTAYEAHAEDDDFVQPGNLVRNVLDDAARDRLVTNIVAQLCNGVTEPVRQRAFDYLRHVDKELGDRIEGGVREAK
jgi:catalase